MFVTHLILFDNCHFLAFIIFSPHSLQKQWIKVSLDLPNDMVSHCRRLQSSATPLYVPQTLLHIRTLQDLI